MITASDAAPAPILTAPAASIVMVELESKSCGPPLADNEPLKNRVSHLCASLPRLCESLAFGIISEVISAPKLTASESESPNVIVPLTKKRKIIVKFTRLQNYRLYINNLNF